MDVGLGQALLQEGMTIKQHVEAKAAQQIQTIRLAADEFPFNKTGLKQLPLGVAHPNTAGALNEALQLITKTTETVGFTAQFRLWCAMCVGMAPRIGMCFMPAMPAGLLLLL